MIWLVIIWIIVLTFGIVILRGAPYVPSLKRYVHQAFTELYQLNSKDVLVDAGSGDGVVLRIAAKHGARAIGYKINPILVMLSRFLSRRNKKITVKLADFWLAKLPKDTTVVYAFTASPYVKKMAVKMQHEADRLGRPLRFIIHGNLLDGRQADKQAGPYSLYTFSPLQTNEP